MYQALYRKWRPKTFDEVAGQVHVTKTLKSEVTSGKISHAYLFTGSRGTGKTSCAKILAKAVNCQSPANGNPCLNCSICKSIETENILDILEIDAASNNGVENIRSMREEAVFTPAQCKYRVYIVDEVHMLSTGAFNAFLKILEEPPQHVIFILATTELHKLPPTIISRCQKFDFARILKDEIAKKIEYICSEENILIEKNAVKIISNAADGAMRDALSILDQCANSCQNNITEEEVKKILGISGVNYSAKILKFIKDGNPEECIFILNELYMQSLSMIKLCEELMECFRNLMINSFNSTSYMLSDNLEINFKEFTLGKILYSLDTLQQCYRNINSGSSQKLEMEIALIKICSQFTNQTHKVESAQPSSGQSVQKVKDSVTTNDKDKIKEIKEPMQIENENKAQKAKNETSEPITLAAWSEILNELKNNKSLKSMYMSLKLSNAYEQGNFILIESRNSLAFELLRNSEYRNSIKKIINKVTGRTYSIGPYTSPNPKPDHTPDPLEGLIKEAESLGVNIKPNEGEI